MGGEQRKFVVVGNWKMNGDKGCSRKKVLNILEQFQFEDIHDFIYVDIQGDPCAR